MDIKTYLSQERGRQAALAKAIGAHAPDVSRWADGTRPIPVAYGAAIERATGGLVTRREMFPDDWQRIWPELAVSNPPQPESQPQ
jgi:DNA-binding transcriptional regulator YdaS (Cro superfamily)